MKNVRFVYCPDLMVAVAIYNGMFYIPILDFENIGKDGDYQKPFEYTISKESWYAPNTLEWVSRNKVPYRVKRAFDVAIQKIEEGEEPRVCQADVDVRWTLDDIKEWEARFPHKRLRGVMVA